MVKRHGRQRPDLSLAGLGFELLAAVVGFTLLGVWIDRRWETGPWGLVICAAIGIVGGLYNFVRLAIRASKRSSGSGRADR